MYLSYFERYLSSTEQESLERFTLCDALITCTRLIQRTPAGLLSTVACLLITAKKKKPRPVQFMTPEQLVYLSLKHRTERTKSMLFA